MADRQHEPRGEGGHKEAAHRRTGDTGVRSGNRGQPPGGEKDARGLTRDRDFAKDEDEAPVPGDAARGPWATDTTPKGD